MGSKIRGNETATGTLFEAPWPGAEQRDWLVIVLLLLHALSTTALVLALVLRGSGSVEEQGFVLPISADGVSLENRFPLFYPTFHR